MDLLPEPHASNLDAFDFALCIRNKVIVRSNPTILASVMSLVALLLCCKCHLMVCCLVAVVATHGSDDLLHAVLGAAVDGGPQLVQQ